MSNDIREWLVDLRDASRSEQAQLVRLLIQHGEPVESYMKGDYFDSIHRWDLLFFDGDYWMLNDLDEYSEEEYEDRFYDYYHVRSERLRERLTTRKKVGGI